MRGLACLGVLWVGLGIIGFGIEAFLQPPDFGSLNITSDRLTGNVVISRGYRAPTVALVPLPGKTAKIENICFLWDCGLPSDIQSLRSGDAVKIWLSGKTVWQFSDGDQIILSYSQAVDAYRKANSRFNAVIGYPVTIIGFIFLGAWAAFKRRALSREHSKNS